MRPALPLRLGESDVVTNVNRPSETVELDLALNDLILGVDSEKGHASDAVSARADAEELPIPDDSATVVETGERVDGRKWRGAEGAGNVGLFLAEDDRSGLHIQ